VSLTDDSTREIKEIGRIDLRMTSEKVVTLQDVLHLATIQRNLINKSFLLKVGYRIAKESNKFVISKSNIFFGKGFVCDGFLWLNVIE